MKNINLSYGRLNDDIYRIEKVFKGESYDWQGDWEGRALLAFNCLYEMTGGEIPCMHDMIRLLPQKTNKKLYLGKEFDGTLLDEQQIFGSSWYLRGLVAYTKNFDSQSALEAAKSTVENLYLPALSMFENYPLDREKTGGVCGGIIGEANHWKLTSDIGAAFACADGLSAYYELVRDDECRKILDVIIDKFASVDFVEYGFQTHSTLTCTRGILNMYEITGEKNYLDLARRSFQIYMKRGMTLTYENYNWFGREDSWTEPCAVVDSFILALRFYHITGEEKYRVLARRIWFNGLQFCQRSNGGAGTNTCVKVGQPYLKIGPVYEATFCCTMRYPEGLLYYHKNEELFDWNENAPEITDEYGRHFVDDKLIVEYEGKRVPIFSCNTYPRDEAEKIALRVLY